VFRVSKKGGDLAFLAKATAGCPRGVHLAVDDVIVYEARDSLFTLPLAGGEPKELMQLGGSAIFGSIAVDQQGIYVWGESDDKDRYGLWSLPR
jgi:hypothetical protein